MLVSAPLQLLAGSGHNTVTAGVKYLLADSGGCKVLLLCTSNTPVTGEVEKQAKKQKFTLRLSKIAILYTRWMDPSETSVNGNLSSRGILGSLTRARANIRTSCHRTSATSNRGTVCGAQSRVPPAAGSGRCFLPCVQS